jgi:L1 cell adhesion molecule like protein
MPRGVPQIEITYDLDANGILNVTAVEKSTGKSEKIEVKNDSSRLSKDEIDKMIKDSEKYAEEDIQLKERIDLKNDLESYAFQMKNMLESDNSQVLSVDIKDNLLKETNNLIEWLSVNNNATIDELKEKKLDFKEKMEPLLKSTGVPISSSNVSEESSKPSVEDVD